jgi:NAD(P)-dependent dehydrogenase (short-subunit alcohol dehydrogenase family)
MTRCDVTDKAQVAAALDLAVARHGKLDMIFNNVGVVGSLSRPSLGELDLGDFNRVMAVNTRGVMADVKHATRVMVPCFNKIRGQKKSGLVSYVVS